MDTYFKVIMSREQHRIAELALRLFTPKDADQMDLQAEALAALNDAERVR